ncbi:MAG: efflux RND transporter periplasmic adaptor subunit [Burkholderiales bacterium]
MAAQDHPARRWVERALFIAAAIAIAAFVFRNAILGKPVDVYQAVRTDLVQTIVASGRIMTPQRISIGSAVTGRVASIPVAEGQNVKRGDVLIELQSRDERAALAQAQAAVAQAEAKLRQLRELGLPAAEQTLVQAQAQAVQARRQYERNLDLKEKGFVSQAVLDDAKRSLDVAESQLRAAMLQVKSNSPAGSDFAVALTALAQAHASVGAAQAHLDETVIRAPASGTLIGRTVEPGNIVQPGKELMALAPEGETQVVVQIDEKNLAQLRIGQKALGSADAFPRERFAAEVVYINPGVDALRGSGEVKLRVADPPAYLRQDMTASVDIEVARRAGAVVVPADAVRGSSGDKPWVLAVTGGHVERRAVTLGLRGDGRAEITHGVAPGDLVIPGNNLLVKPGARVRAVVVVKDGA